MQRSQALDIEKQKKKEQEEKNLLKRKNNQKIGYIMEELEFQALVRNEIENALGFMIASMV